MSDTKLAKSEDRNKHGCCFFDCTDIPKSSEDAYFRELFVALSRDGVDRNLLTYLARYDLSNFNAEDIPHADAAAAARDTFAGLSPPARFICAIAAGNVAAFRSEEIHRVSVGDFREEFDAWCEDNGIEYAGGDVAFGREIAHIIGPARQIHAKSRFLSIREFSREKLRRDLARLFGSDIETTEKRDK
jgi:hypothetical protein